VSSDPFESREILVGVTGGIAAYKAAELVSRLRQRGAAVRVVMTAAARQFVQPLTFAVLSGRRVITDLFEQPEHYETEHIALAQKTELAIIAPATANFLGKVASGIADDALTTMVLSLSCPIVVAPAMNHRMWSHPQVQRNVARLRELGHILVEPQAGWLACGETGVGRLADLDSILAAAERAGDPTSRAPKRE
jgi:phosphopantothenoylcysteine decarboxylase/phosphopantothenate--cysteine ligase